MTTKDLEASSFLRFTIILQIIFTNQPPNVVSQHVLVVLSLVTAFKVQYILVEALALLLRVRSQVELIKMSIKDMDFEGHPTAHYAVVLHQSLSHCGKKFSCVTDEGLNAEFYPFPPG